MITQDGKLEKLENFRSDHNLPKFRRDDDEDGMNEKMVGAFIRSKSIVLSDTFSGNISIEEDDDFNTSGDDGPSWSVKNWVQRLIAWFLAFFKKKELMPEISILEFFKAVKNNTGSLVIVEQRAKGYEEAIANAKECGQRALVEQLTNNLTAARAEAHLVEMDLKKFITEDNLVKFVKKSPKGLRLDWVANFTRMIPADVLYSKKQCDARMIFDNYLILHYDPEAKSYAETQAEKEARKDPILFGVIKGRRQLYYVGDWIDEVCDLTLDQIADLIGNSTIEEIK